MPSEKIPISSILIEDRQRTDLGDIDSLAASLSRLGLIQPIIVNHERRLVAGGRRLEAAKRLGWTEIPAVFRETLSEDELQELELEENIRRKDIDWRERIIAIAKIHRLKVKRGLTDGESWGYRETGELLGVALGDVSFAINTAAELRNDPASPFWQCENAFEAKRLVLRRAEDAALAESARRHQSITITHEEEKALHEDADKVAATAANPDLLAYERQRYYSNPLNPPGSFEDYWHTREKEMEEVRRTVYLRNRLYHGDAIEFMQREENEEAFDHIVTDPPYGIDMEMLDQQNQGMVDIDTVAAEHDMQQNKELMARFFPAAWRCLKPNAFVVLWCDQMLWQLLYDWATEVGFAVQRWPLTWVKTHRCGNNAAQYNFTKTTETAMVCRKGNAIMTATAATSHIAASHDEMRTTLGHPFVKPFAVWEFILKHISIPGQTIYEPFAGRGSGVLSMLRMERNVFATESNEAHYNALLENVKQYYRTVNPDFVFK